MTEEDIWAKIKRLRISDMSLLAPVVRSRVGLSLKIAEHEVLDVTVKGQRYSVPMKAYVVETLRVQELQEIYYGQKTSKVKNVLYGSHAYGVAVDIVSVQYGWFTGAAAVKAWPDKDVRNTISVLWFKRLADIVTADKVMAWGGLWKKFPDSPHFQSARTPVSPNDAMRQAYATAGGGEAGRKAVWAMFGLDASATILA